MKTAKVADYIAGSSGFIGTYLTASLGNNNNVYIGKIDRALKFKPTLNYPLRDVYYLSSYGNLFGQTQASKTYTVNCENPQVLLDFILEVGFRLFFYFSSSSVYQKQHRAFKETDPVLGTTDYVSAKIIGENSCKLYADDTRVVIIRPFSVTGIGEQDIHLIPALIRAAYTGRFINLDPTPVHDFINVLDVCSALKVIAEEEKNKKTGISYWNIGSGIQYSNLEVLQLVEKVSGQKINYKIAQKLRPYDTNDYWVANITKLNSLGWEPRHSLEQTISTMCADYVRHKAN